MKFSFMRDEVELDIVEFIIYDISIKQDAISITLCACSDNISTGGEDYTEAFVDVNSDCVGIDQSSAITDRK